MNQRLPVILSAIALGLGWGALALMLFGPSYSTASSSLDSNGVMTQTTGSASLLQVGLEPITVFWLGLFALSYLAVLAGAVFTYRGHQRARIVMGVGIVPLVALGAISFGLVLALPASMLAVVATVLVFMRPARPKVPPLA